MNPDLLHDACSLYRTTPGQLIPLSGGHFNAVYRFPLQQPSQIIKTGEVSRSGVLRIGVEDCPAEQTLGMLECISFLNEQGAPVTAPIASTQGRLLERLEQNGKAYTITAFEEAEGTLAERIPPNELTNELFRSIGQAVGKMHAISSRYRPSRSELTRPQWFDSYEIQDALKRLGRSTDPAGEKLTPLIEELKLLPTEPANFGLIHNDLHFANFLIHSGGKVTIIDFDDCVYGWFVADIAMALFDVLVLYHGTSEKDNQDFAKRFMSQYLTGYRKENGLSMFWQEQIPRFLKLKELCVYAPLIGHPDINLPDSWVGRFMQDRAERIVHDVPYLDIDFMLV